MIRIMMLMLLPVLLFAGPRPSLERLPNVPKHYTPPPSPVERVENKAKMNAVWAYHKQLKLLAETLGAGITNGMDCAAVSNQTAKIKMHVKEQKVLSNKKNAHAEK